MGTFFIFVLNRHAYRFILLELDDKMIIQLEKRVVRSALWKQKQLY